VVVTLLKKGAKLGKHNTWKKEKKTLTWFKTYWKRRAFH